MESQNITLPTLLNLYIPVFALISTLEANDDFGKPEDLAEKILKLLQDVRDKCTLLDKNPDWIEDAQNAMIAFVDEKINSSKWHGREVWRQKPLAVRSNLTTNTGTLFFESLDGWMRNPLEKTEILEVFYVCLSLGFQGQYFMQQDKLVNLRKEVLREITGHKNSLEILSPSAYSKHEDTLVVQPDTFPWSWLISVATGVLLLLFAVLKIVSVREINHLVEQLK